MKKIALFVRHKAKPGHREQIQRVWERYVKPRVETNPAHELYYFCFDINDPNIVCAFQLFTDEESKNAFLAEAWYPQYLEEISELIAEAPTITSTYPIWNK